MRVWLHPDEPAKGGARAIIERVLVKQVAGGVRGDVVLQRARVELLVAIGDGDGKKIAPPAFADQAALAWQLASAQRQMRELSILTDRDRIARDLHDSLGQELSGAKMMVDCIQMPNQSAEWKERAAAEASTLIDQAIQQVRSMSHLLHPPMLDEIGLRSSLQWYLDGLTKRAGLETSLDLQPEEFPRLGAELETTVFRIVQEALTNVYRHAEAKKATIKLAIRDGGIVITVRDDGKGVSDSVADFEAGKIGIGIAGMRQRVKELGGDLRLRKGNPGTLLEATIPVQLPRSAEPLTVSKGISH